MCQDVGSRNRYETFDDCRINKVSHTLNTGSHKEKMK